jgi:quinol monooxygenase YgiN
MSKVALVVELEMVPGQRDAFLDRVRQHGKMCLEREPGCHVFDVLVPDEGGDRVFLYEVYADKAAVEHHVSTPYMARYLEDTGPMIAQRTRNLCRLVGD